MGQPGPLAATSLEDDALRTALLSHDRMGGNLTAPLAEASDTPSRIAHHRARRQGTDEDRRPPKSGGPLCRVRPGLPGDFRKARRDASTRRYLELMVECPSRREPYSIRVTPRSNPSSGASITKSTEQTQFSPPCRAETRSSKRSQLVSTSSPIEVEPATFRSPAVPTERTDGGGDPSTWTSSPFDPGPRLRNRRNKPNSRRRDPRIPSRRNEANPARPGGPIRSADSRRSDSSPGWDPERWPFNPHGWTRAHFSRAGSA